MTLCKCGCRGQVAKGRTFIDKQHQIAWQTEGSKKRRGATAIEAISAAAPLTVSTATPQVGEIGASLDYGHRLVQPEISIIHQVCAVLASLVVFVAIWLLATAFLMLFAQSADLGFGWLDSVFRDVFAPWAGGYAGLSLALGRFQKSTAKFVFLSFAVVMLLLVGAYLGMIGIVRTEAGITVGSYIWGALTLVAGIVGAYKAASDNGLRF